MTPAEKEVAAVQEAYSRAAAAYGAQVAAAAIREWAAVNRFTPAGRVVMVARMVTLVVAARVVMATLAARKAQLIQALTTGSQMAGGPSLSTLQELRDAYEEALRPTGVIRPLRARALDPTTPVPVDEALGSLAGIVEEVNDGIDKEIEETIRTLGDARLGRIAKTEGVVRPGDVDTSRNMVAAGLERIALNGGRHTDGKIARRNKSVYGVLRMHNDFAGDKPCAFCAMLLSRGAVYLSVETASNWSEESGEMDRYHSGCHCTAELVHSRADYETNPRYALNRTLQAEWKSAIKGKFTGDAALPAWRSHVKTLFADGEENKSARVAA